MHIKTVILEGFKSYGPRTQIGPFDRHFNAITGLNGSGKSNILDGIIFVLGLSSLSSVRADNLMELINKTSGVKRASVSVIFDNMDKRSGKCPLGYDRYSEIIVTRTVEESGQCKYYLNGCVSTKKKIVDMFESVQLNISNPNFVIQQGKITKVVNMKPKEILVMIEETVGATVYQVKRDKTHNDLMAKDMYLDNSKKILHDVIMPALAKQRKAAQYLSEYNSLKGEVNAKSQKYAIAAFGKWTHDVNALQDQLSKFQTEDRNDKVQIKEIEGGVEEKKKEIQQMKEQNTNRVKDKLEAAEKELSKFRKAFDAAKAQMETAKTNQKEAAKRVQNAEKAYKNESKAVEDFKTKSSNLIEESNAIQSEIETAENNLKGAKDRESEINAGKVLGDDGQTINLREKLIALNDEINEISPKYDHEIKLISNEKKSLKEKEAEIARTQPDDQLERDYQIAATEVEKLKRQLSDKQVIPEEFSQLEAHFHDLRTRMSGFDRQKQQMINGNPILSFDYKDPYPNFDRSNVHGFLFELFRLKDSETYGNPFEVATSGLWSIVIVDNPQISRALIERGQLAKRTTFMPMSTIQSRGTARQVDLDKAVAAGNAVPCLDLIEYDKKYAALMAHYFGRLVICKDGSTAKQVAFNMGFKSITMDGDVVDPDGFMQGGTRRNLGHYLKTWQNFAAVNAELRQVEKEFEHTKSKFEYYKRFESLIKNFETANRKLGNASNVRGLSKFSELQKEILKLKETIGERGERIKGWDSEIKRLQKESIALEKKLECEADVKAKSLKETQTQISKFQKALEQAKKKYEAKQKMYSDIDLEVQARNEILANYQQDIDTAKTELQEAHQNIEKKSELVGREEEIFREKEQVVENIIKENQAYDEEVTKLEETIKELQKAKHKLEVTKIKRDNDINDVNHKIKARSRDVQALQEEYDTVNFADYENLPKPKESVQELKHTLETAKKRKQEMETKVDIESAEKLEVTALGAKSAAQRAKQVERNRENIAKAIDTLDSQKLMIVTEAYEKINKEFGEMMKTLLPESEAKLVLVDPNDLSQGLNIHVCLGGVWKESLTELSGGQRSLVALALTLSLCMFNPAPFYVLDEVDAALDLSHTQNMGVIIQQRFKDTQFVCVSLKEGMYSNANTLLSVSFNRGYSCVDLRQRAGGAGSSTQQKRKR